jgi:hypothetical protein
MRGCARKAHKRCRPAAPGRSVAVAMTFPRVIEIPLPLEPVSHDPFVDELEQGEPRGVDPDSDDAEAERNRARTA